jgi:hypothetical protein
MHPFSWPPAIARPRSVSLGSLFPMATTTFSVSHHPWGGNSLRKAQIRGFQRWLRLHRRSAGKRRWGGSGVWRR